MSWGDNTFGQLGNPGTPLGPPNSDVPVPVQGLPGTATAVSAGGQFSLALLTGGSVAAWGDNALGQLGNGSTSDSTTPVTVTGLTGATAITAGSDYGAAPVATPGPAVMATPEFIFHIPDVWAVGQDFSSNSGGITLLFEHFNGTKWTVFPSPATVGAPFAQAITTISANDAWVVGSNALATTLAAHWNGTTWTIVPCGVP